jgi:hypothetical protein
MQIFEGADYGEKKKKTTGRKVKHFLLPSKLETQPWGRDADFEGADYGEKKHRLACRQVETRPPLFPSTLGLLSPPGRPQRCMPVSACLTHGCVSSALCCRMGEFVRERTRYIEIIKLSIF